MGEKEPKLLDFLNKRIFTSKHNTRIFLYYLENKQKSLVDMMAVLGHIEFFKLDINLDKYKTIDDFRDEDGEINFGKLKDNFGKILKLNKKNKQEKYLNQFDNYIKSKNIVGLEELLTENFIEYFKYLYSKKLKIKIISNLKKAFLGQNINLDSIDDTKLYNPIFLEAYKMSLDPKYNKIQINQLLLDYLTGKFDNIEELNQYKTPKNEEWLKNNLDQKQQEIWLYPEIKTIIIDNGEDRNDQNKDFGQENTFQRINHHIEIAIKKIKEINKFGFDFKTNFLNENGEFKKYFNLEIKKKESEIKDRIGKSNIYEDLKLQINSILELEKQSSNQKTKKSTKIIIERELNPLKSLMMGNLVDGSCLNFYDSIGNYYSAISNTIDVNKAVFYIKNEDGTLLGRCLITIGNDKKLSRYIMYYSGKVDAQIDQYFDEYTIRLADKLGLELNGDEYKVEQIESEAWYKDGIKKV